MQEEIQRILQLVEDGRLTRAQAAEMIAALASAAAEEGDATIAGETPGDQRSRNPDDEPGRAEARHHERGGEGDPHRSAHRRHHRRRRHRHFAHFTDDKLYDEIERAVSAGARALHDVMSSSFAMGAHGWDGDTNTSTLSKADAPEGAGFRCSDNRFSVSKVRGLRLNDAEFCGNELNAAALAEMEVRNGSFNHNAISGSSLRNVIVERSDVSANSFNGAQITRLNITRGKLTDSHFQGTQVRDLSVASSVIDAMRCDGVRLRSVALSAETHLRDLDLTGVAGTDWVFDDAQLSGVVLSGWRIEGFTLNRVGLEDCTFRNDDAFQYTRGHHRRRDLPRARDLCIDRVVMKNCDFINCTFNSTIIRNCSVENLRFENVDFTDMTISGSEALTAMARQTDVA